jgi:hypothetical protein
MYPGKRNQLNARTYEAAEVDVLRALANNHHLSTQQTGSYLGTPKTSTRHILKSHKNRYTKKCMRTGFQNNVEFCQWSQQQLQTGEKFFQHVLFN